MPYAELLLIALSLAGFFLALYIFRKKHAPKPMICPMRSNCTDVVTSAYATFFGIPVEVLGMFYYAATAILHGIFLLRPEFATPDLSFLLALMSTAGMLFSLYLVSIQAFALKRWCTWCLFSAGICLGIFLLTATHLPITVIETLTEHRRLVTILHLFGVCLGVGTATITDIFFFRFLKDFRISQEESETLGIFSQVIWFALGILVLSGLALVLPESERLLASSKFLVKVIGVGVLIANGILLNIVISPKLIHISFRQTHRHHPGELHHLRKLAFASGAISITTWYFVFVLGALRKVSATFSDLLTIYLALLLLAIIGSQIYDRIFSRVRSGGE